MLVILVVCSNVDKGTCVNLNELLQKQWAMLKKAYFPFILPWVSESIKKANNCCPSTCQHWLLSCFLNGWPLHIIVSTNISNMVSWFLKQPCMSLVFLVNLSCWVQIVQQKGYEWKSWDLPTGLLIINQHSFSLPQKILSMFKR